MHYQKHDVGSYNLHTIKTDNFKSISVQVNFRQNIEKENITMRNVLEEVLLDTCEEFKTRRELIKETENLYDLRFQGSVRHIGQFSVFSFSMTFLEPTYAKEVSLEEMLSFLTKIIFHPNVTDGKFDTKSLERSKRKIERNIEKALDNKTTYAIKKLHSLMSDLPYSYDITGNIKDLEKIDEKNLYDYYKEILKTDIIDIFIVGNIDEDRVKTFFKENFKIDTFKKEKTEYLIKETDLRKRLKKETEKVDINQSVLTMGLSLHNITDFERRYVFPIYNEILGGGSGNSVLFEQVREKNSLAYYTYSISEMYNSIMIIAAGISKSKVETVLKLIKKSLDIVEKGKFSTEKFESSKKTIISGIVTSEDSPYSIMATYYIMNIAGGHSIKERIEYLNKVTITDVINFAKKVKPHTVFLLEEANHE